jgi:hypothetical protein
MIVTTDDPGFSKSGVWGKLSDGLRASGLYANSLGDNGGQSTDEARFQFRVLPGTYEVYTTWSKSGNRSPAAPYYIYEGATLIDSQSFNQINPPANSAPLGITAYAAPWQKIGTYALSSTQFAVHIKGNAPGFSVASAVYIKRVGP